MEQSFVPQIIAEGGPRWKKFAPLSHFWPGRNGTNCPISPGTKFMLYRVFFAALQKKKSPWVTHGVFFFTHACNGACYIAKKKTKKKL